MIITDGEHFALIKEELSGSYSKKYVLIKQWNNKRCEQYIFCDKQSVLFTLY